jgi:hypothetical protein
MLFTVRLFSLSERMAFTEASAAERLVAWEIQLIHIQPEFSACMQTVLPSGFQTDHILRHHIRRDPLQDGKMEIVWFPQAQELVPTVACLRVVQPATQKVTLTIGGPLPLKLSAMDEPAVP